MSPLRPRFVWMLYINETTNKIYVATDNKKYVRDKRPVIST